MNQELVHLCEKRFNLDLQELQDLIDNTEKLQEDLRIKNKVTFAICMPSTHAFTWTLACPQAA